MEIWLDTINTATIQEAQALGLVSGVTTNPAILSKAEQVDSVLLKILDIQAGAVAVQVTSSTHDEMIDEGRFLSEFSDRILVKIPVNREGLLAIRQLSQENIPVLGTAIFHPKQALLAAQLGALYVAPYFSHIANAGIDPFIVLQTIQEIMRAQSLKTKIMAASLKQIDQVIRCAQMGIEAVTLKDDIYTTLVEDHPISEAFTKKFNLQWQEAFPDTSLVETLHY